MPDTEHTPDRPAFDEAMVFVEHQMATFPPYTSEDEKRALDALRAYADSRDRLVDALLAFVRESGNPPHGCPLSSALCPGGLSGGCGTPECQDAIMRWREGEGQ